MPSLPDALAASLEAERKFLLGLCYRMTGSTSDAEDIVQDTFVRAMERPPRDTARELRPWLVHVAMNLARDQLRRRKRRGYHGVWLPTPLETGDGADLSDDGEASPEARYGVRESVSFAFLVALEALTPAQRGVLLLRDAFDFTSREAAHALSLSEENVRITLHRARKAMAGYDAERAPPHADRPGAIDVLYRFLGSVARGDLEAARELFAVDARMLSDGGGLTPAGMRPMVGRDRIVKMYAKLATRASGAARLEPRTFNAMPSVAGQDSGAKSPNAPRFIMLVDLDRDGKIRTLYSVLAPPKVERALGGRRIA